MFATLAAVFGILLLLCVAVIEIHDSGYDQGYIDGYTEPYPQLPAHGDWLLEWDE